MDASDLLDLEIELMDLQEKIESVSSYFVPEELPLFYEVLRDFLGDERCYA